jgi:hypothetical protein
MLHCHYPGVRSLGQSYKTPGPREDTRVGVSELALGAFRMSVSLAAQSLELRQPFSHVSFGLRNHDTPNNGLWPRFCFEQPARGPRLASSWPRSCAPRPDAFILPRQPHRVTDAFCDLRSSLRLSVRQPGYPVVSSLLHPHHTRHDEPTSRSAALLGAKPMNYSEHQSCWADAR